MARDSFRSRRGFIIACIGSAVGMGNIWLFPARVSEFGGAAFLIPYFICVIVIGFTGVVGEMAFGRAMGAGPMGAFGAATEKAGKGRTPGELLSLIPVLGSLALAIGYSVVVGWILKYLVGSLSGNLFEISGVEGYADTFNQTAASFGNIGWHLTALAITFAIMVYGIASGIEKANKVMMPLFFVMFVGMAVYIATLPGASQGYRYLTDPDWSLLAAWKDPGIRTGTSVLFSVFSRFGHAGLRLLSQKEMWTYHTGCQDCRPLGYYSGAGSSCDYNTGHGYCRPVSLRRRSGADVHIPA